MRQSYKLIFERSHEGRRAYDLPELDVPAVDAIPANMKNEANRNSGEAKPTAVFLNAGDRRQSPRREHRVHAVDAERYVVDDRAVEIPVESYAK